MAAVNRSLSGVFTGPRAGDHRSAGAKRIDVRMWSGMALAAEGGGGGLSILWGVGGTAAYRLGLSAPTEFTFEHPVVSPRHRNVSAGGFDSYRVQHVSLMQLGPALEELYGGRYFSSIILTGAFGFLVSSL